jgi:hypothetical protein
VSEAPIASGSHAGHVHGIRVFSASTHQERNGLGREATSWLEANPDVRVASTIVTQSSSASYHCVTVTLLCSVLPSSVVPPDAARSDLARDRLLALIDADLAVARRDLAKVAAHGAEVVAIPLPVGATRMSEFCLERVRAAISTIDAMLAARREAR